jgi:hypothetical protein
MGSILRRLRQRRLPTFFDGLASVIDIWGFSGPPPHASSTPWEDDARALASDWQRVGDDLRAVADRRP